MNPKLHVVSRRDEMKRKRYGDRREMPRYTASEVARYLSLPDSTVWRWFFGQPGFAPFFAPADPDGKQLSFYNLVEAFALSWANKKYKGLRQTRIRQALEYVRQHFPQYERPLIAKKFSTDGKFMFIQDLEQGEEGDAIVPDATTINASQWGQLLLPSMNKVLELIEYDEADLAKIVYPTQGHKLVAINPSLSSGRPVVKGTGILASIIWQRAEKAQEPIERLAKDYNLSKREIQTAIDYIEAA